MDKENTSIFNYAPSSENAVYFLLGLLWEEIPYNFIFDEFEIDPNKKNYGFKKYVDACGKEWKDGKWIEVNFEFKLRSSGLLEDIKKYPNFKPDWLICWEHDAKAAELYTDNILCLSDIYNSLSDKKQNMTIKNPQHKIKMWNNASTMDDLLSRFSKEIQPKVSFILETWKEYVPGNSEIILSKSGKTVARVCSYSSEYLLIHRNKQLIDHVKNKYKTVDSGYSIRILLKHTSIEEISEILDKIKMYNS